MAYECPKCQTKNPEDSKFCKECATPLPGIEEAVHTKTLETPTEELTTGSIFAGRYQIIEELGKGGMGRVYKALDKETKEKIALKLIKPDIASDKKTIERFRNELTTARKIVQKNVCRMYDLNREKDNYYITMEYVSGGDLKKFIRRAKRLDMGTAISIAKQICDGLEEAHGLGIVHRDLKPNNIIIDDNGNARIMDFGIARVVKGKGITESGVMIGTPEYMSLEQAEAKEVDQRSDIYSLGVIMYEMVTGRVPFEGDTALSIVMKHKGEEPKDPREFNSQISEDLSRVIMTCLEKEKEKRYQSAGELWSEIENIEKRIPTTERVVPKRKPITSKEITVTFSMKKFLIPALVVLATAVIGLMIWSPWANKAPSPIIVEKPSIAVLPFDDLSPQKDQEYFCNGLAESLINALSKIKGLRVPALTSTVSFKGEELDLGEIGEKLSVRTVLRGSVQKAGDRFRITAQLINITDESLLWSDQYNPELNDLFSVQDEISLAIVHEFKVNLLGEEKESLLKRYTENIEAYNLYLKGRHFWNRRTEDGLKKAIEYFEQSIQLDPIYALAFAGLADCYIVLPFYSSYSPEEVYPKAKNAALKALRIDNNLAEAYTSLSGLKLWYDWDWPGAEKEIKQAIQLNPNLAIAHHWFSELLKSTGRIDESIEEIRRAIELDPLSVVINREYGVYLILARQYDEAIQQLKKVLEIDSEHRYTYEWLGQAYLQKGKYKEALDMFQKIESPGLAYVLTATGKKNEALKVLDKFIEKSSKEYIDPFDFAIIYLGLGEIDKTFEALEKAYQEHSVSLVDYTYLNPYWDGIRSDSRFRELMKKLNLE